MTRSRYLARWGSSLAVSLRVVEALLEVGDVVAERGHAFARDLLADEVADQQAEERVALHRRERDGGAGVRRRAPVAPFSVRV